MAAEQPSPDPVATAQALTSALRDVEKRMGVLRRVVRWVAISLVIDVVITIGLGVVTLEVLHNRADASAQRTSDITACQQSNVTRADEVHLWDYLYTLARQSGPPPSPAVQKADNELLAYIRRTFAPRDCQRLYKAP